MNKNTIITVVVVLVIVLGGGVLISRANKKTDLPASTNTSTTDKMSKTDKPTAKDPNTIVLKNLDFETKTLTIKKGSAVTWKNEDTASHTITFDDAAMASANSELFGPGKTYQHMFETAGTFAYHCTPHPFMKGTIVVTE